MDMTTVRCTEDRTKFRIIPLSNATPLSTRSIYWAGNITKTPAIHKQKTVKFCKFSDVNYMYSNGPYDDLLLNIF